MSDPVDIEAQEERQRVQEELDVIHSFIRNNDMEWVLSDERGRRFVWWLLEEAGVYSSSYDGTSEGTIFNEGNRVLGLKVLERIHEISPEKYLQMIKERENYERHVIDIQRNGFPDAE